MSIFLYAFLQFAKFIIPYLVKKESELSLLEKASQEMKALGFTSIEQYLAYKAK